MGGEWSCVACEAVSPVTFRFCGQCGAAAPVNPSPPALNREERRQITVLFSDASGYTTMAEHLDPEVVREVMGRVYAQAESIAVRYGGRVDKLMGDAVLVVFGDPVAHEDDAERAVRAALELHAAVDAMRPELEALTGSAFRMHSGINSGVVITGDLHDDRASGPLGDTVNVAARLQSLAASGEVLIGPETYTMVKSRFAFADLGERELKGRSQAVHVRRIEGFASEAKVPSRRAGAFVGRHEELGILVGAVDRLHDGASSVISVCAEAGAGKTRLLEEVRRHLADDVIWLEGRAYAYTADIPYSPVIDLLSGAAGIDEGDSAQEVRHKLSSMVERNLPGDEAVMPVLIHLYDPASAESTVDLESFRSMLLTALASLIRAVSRRGPTVVCLQDLHWVDPSTVDLIRQLTTIVDAPFVMICNFRPGFTLGVPGERVVKLTELSGRQTREQLQSLLETDELRPGLLDAVTDRTEGNPFFAEEIVNSLIETDVLAREDSGWVLRRRIDELALPSTIRGLIAARIDGLDLVRRRVLREVSVVGREFLYRLVRSVSTEPDELDGSLGILAAADLIREKVGDPDLEYIFKHALTQEVAYEGLLRRDRQQLHERVGRAIESQLGDRVDEFVETLAYHFQRSGQVVDAVGYLRRAARRALERYSMIECHNHYRAAYNLLTHEDPEDRIDDATKQRLLLVTILDWATAHYYSGEYGGLHEVFAAHVTLAADVGDDALRARWLAWRGNVVWNRDYDISGAISLFDEALLLSRACGDATAEAYALAWLPWVLANNGQPARALTMWPELQAILESVPDATDRRYVHIKGLAGAAIAAAVSGDTLTARAQAKELLELGTRTGNRRASAMAHLVLVAVCQVVGNNSMLEREAKAAVACDADPIYRWLGEIYIAAAALGGSQPTDAGYLTEQYRVEPTRQGHGALALAYTMIAAMATIVDGHVIRGLRDLAAVREAASTSGDLSTCASIDFNIARAYVLLASGDLPISRVKNPGLLLLLPVAARRGRAGLEGVKKTLADHGMNGMIPAVEYQLGLVCKHQHRTKEARSHLDAVEEMLSTEPYAFLRAEASKALGEL